MKRRSAVLGGLFATVAGSVRAAADVTVIYIGDWDCPYCTVWKNEDKPKWLASNLSKRVRYVEIEAPHLKEVYQERYWPDDLRPILAQVPHKRGTPRFLIVRAGRIVSNDFGHHKWQHALDAVRKELG